MFDLVRLELDRQGLAAYPCGCGRGAAHLRDELLRLAGAETEEDAEFDVVGGHLMGPSVLMPAALPVVSVALAALAGGLAEPARRRFLEMLLLILAGEGQSDDPSLLGRDLVDECHKAAQAGLWLVYHQIFVTESVGVASYAFEVVSVLDENQERVERVRLAAGDRLSHELRS